MFKPRTIAVVVAMAVASSAALASSAATAAAAGWMVGGSTLTTGASEKLALTTKVDETFVLSAAGTTITCTGIKVENGELIAPNKDSETLVFTGCTVNIPECTVKNGEIATKVLLSEATLEGALAANIQFKPETGTRFAEIEFSGVECAVELLPVTGTTRALAPTGQDERTLQLLTAKTSPGELRLGSAEATLKGSTLVEVECHEPWRLL